MLKLSWKKVAVSIGLTAFAVVGIVFVSRFYPNKNADTSLFNKTDSPSAQVRTDSGDEKVFSRSEMQAIIEGFEVPSEEDIRVFQKDERYSGFLELLKPLEGGISQETKNALIQNSYLLWFRQERLIEKENFGEINMDGFTFGLNMIVKMYNDPLVERLTDEQYTALMGQSKTDLTFDIPDFSDSTRGYSEITSIFPAIRNGEHPEIQSAEDLYKVVPKEAIEKIIAGTRERSKIQREAVRAFRLEKISEKEYEKQIEASTQVMRDAINSAVTPEQEMFLFGYEF